jgi:hypothetical protein
VAITSGEARDRQAARPVVMDSSPLEDAFGGAEID